MGRLETITNAEATPDQKFDLFITSCGYESRATAIAKKISENVKNKIALGFKDNQVLNYAANRDWFVRNGFEVTDVDDMAFRELVERDVSVLCERAARPAIAVDISCMNRLRMAFMAEIFEAAASEIVVTYYYCIATFSPPHVELAPTVTIEPVTPRFSGWTVNPDLPPAVVVGVGYEPTKAMGVIEHLEVDTAAWVFVPVSKLSEYLPTVLESNRDLLESAAPHGRIIHYDVLNPQATFHQLNSLISALVLSYNPILVPFGPKIFCLTSLLVATQYEEVGLWRVSSSHLEQALDRNASPHILGLKVEYGYGEGLSDCGSW